MLWASIAILISLSLLLSLIKRYDVEIKSIGYWITIFQKRYPRLARLMRYYQIFRTKLDSLS